MICVLLERKLTITKSGGTKVKLIKDNFISKHKLWTAVGKPRQGDVYKNMIQAKT